MGGNGQFNRLAALDSIDDGTGPWRDRLTEDQDLGVRLVQKGWRGAQENGAAINQQGLPSLRRLYRQRTRWAQGSWQALSLLGGLRGMRSGALARIDAVYYLLTPVIQLIAGLDFLATIVFWAILRIPIIPGSITAVLVVVTLGFGPGYLTLLLRGRGLRTVLWSLVVAIPYTAYSWLVFPVLAVALIRQLSGRRSWAKTDREPLADDDVGGAGAGTIPEGDPRAETAGG